MFPTSETSLSTEDIERLRSQGHVVMEEEDTKPIKIDLRNFESFENKTRELIEFVLKSPAEKRKTLDYSAFLPFEIPSLFDIITRPEFTGAEVEGIEFLLKMHQRRLRGEDTSTFATEMAKFCQLQK